MKEIGGYFEIEFTGTTRSPFLEGTLRLNSGRNCLEYLLLDRNIRRLYVPFYTCDVLLEPVDRLKVEYKFYHINEQLEPDALPPVDADEAILVTNYFGVKGDYLNSLRDAATSSIFIDNSQALFQEPIDILPSFYSLRKFVGAPDGAFLAADVRHMDIPEADSSERVSHLYRRKDVSAAAGYELFKANDQALSSRPIERMSRSTSEFVDRYDFQENRRRRDLNFDYVHERLRKHNRLDVPLERVSGALCYPFFPDKQGLKEMLIDNQVYVPTYWPNVRPWVEGKDCFERELVDGLVPLPIDQRISVADMDFMLTLILNEL